MHIFKHIYVIPKKCRDTQHTNTGKWHSIYEWYKKYTGFIYLYTFIFFKIMSVYSINLFCNYINCYNNLLVYYYNK